MFKLVIQDDEGKTTIVPLIRDEITIGRRREHDPAHRAERLSRHARILRNNGGSTSRTSAAITIRVNNARIAVAHE
jgi:hypothetical protein